MMDVVGVANTISLVEICIFFFSLYVAFKFDALIVQGTVVEVRFKVEGKRSRRNIPVW